MKAIFIVGMPGAGKTTLTRRVLRYLHKASPSEEVVKDHKLIPSIRYEVDGNVWKVLGVFNKKQLSYVEGTDKMSMGCQPAFAEFCKDKDANMVIEGDRLANIKSVSALKAAGYEVHLFVLNVSDKERQRRYTIRGSVQKEVFIEGRKTKVKNFLESCKSIGVQCTVCTNDTEEHSISIMKKVVRLIK